MKLTVWVCYHDFGVEGCHPPEAVFLTEGEAAIWCRGSYSLYNATYKEFEIDADTAQGKTNAT